MCLKNRCILTTAMSTLSHFSFLLEDSFVGTLYVTIIYRHTPDKPQYNLNYQ